MLNIPIFVKLEWGITLADIVEQEALVYPSFGDLLNFWIDIRVKASACLLMYIIIKIIYELGMGCFYLYQGYYQNHQMK